MWKQEGLDLNLVHYQISATGPNQGLIEVVQDCETIFDIQMVSVVPP